MPPPRHAPLGITLARTAHVVGRAFDEALGAAGGSRSVWLVLVTLKGSRMASQRELADAVGIRGATLTHHLNAMEEDGLVVRRRDPANRRLHLVELTDRGDEMFARLRGVAATFDRRLRTGLDEADQRRLEALLARLHQNVSGIDASTQEQGARTDEC